MNRLVTVREVGALLSVHPKTIYRWTKSGRLPSTRVYGLLRFPEREVKRFLEERTLGITDPAMLLPKEKITLDLAAFDRLHLKPKGGKSAVSRGTRRWNYGFGSVYLRKTKDGRDRWAIDYKDRGRRIREVIQEARTRGEALIALQKRIRDCFAGRFHPAGENESMSFARLADTYIDDYAKVKKRSWKTDYYLVESSMKPFFGSITCGKIRSLDIERYVKHRLDEGVSKATANRCVQVLRRMFNLGIEWGYLAENPASKVKLFSEKDNLKERILSEDEELRLLNASPVHLRPIILCALHTGMRRGEILGLRWDQIDFERRTIRVERTKSGKPRFIDINRTLLELLRRQRVDDPRSEFVFPSNRTGRAFVEVSKAFKRACKLASITGLRFHDLRHTFASRLIARGADIITVKELLGHSSVRITERYTHSQSEQRRQAVSRLDALTMSSLARGCHAEPQGEKKIPANPYFSMN